MIGMRKESDGFRGGVSCMLNMNLKETFKKQGGMKLLEQYWKMDPCLLHLVSSFFLEKVERH